MLFDSTVFLLVALLLSLKRSLSFCRADSTEKHVHLVDLLSESMSVCTLSLALLRQLPLDHFAVL